MGELSYMQIMSIETPHGLRCPYCGKYRKLSDFERQPGHISIGGHGDRIHGHVHVSPACKKCMEE